MRDDSRIELMAIPIVAIILGFGLVLLFASEQGVWAWLLIGLAGLLAIVVVAVRLSKRKPHSTGSTPPPTGAGAAAAAGSTPADGTYRVLVIADESCVDASFPATVSDHAAGRKVEALVVAPAIGSWLSRWTGDESQYVDARTHLDETVAALAAAGIPARGETGADDPLQAADDGLREFPADEIVFVTKSGTQTDWVEKGIVSTAKARYSIPVTHIELAAG